MSPLRPSSLLQAASLMLALAAACGCETTKPYGVEPQLALSGNVRQTWAVAPVINDSGQKGVDPILQADLVYQQLQAVAGLNVIPVNKVAELYNTLHIERITSDEQAALICDVLGADALLIATVSIYDPFDPPKMGASLNLFRRGGYRRPVNVDIRELARRATPATMPASPASTGFVQAVGMFDAANGSVRADALRYAQGRNDPTGPYQARVYLVEMDRYGGFVYHSLIGELLAKPQTAHVSMR
jgi:hypothetical protein